MNNDDEKRLDNATFQSLIKRAILLSYMTREEFGGRLGLCAQTIKHWEDGRMFPPDIVRPAIIRAVKLMMYVKKDQLDQFYLDIDKALARVEQ